MSAPSTKANEVFAALQPSCRTTAAHALTIVRDCVITGNEFSAIGDQCPTAGVSAGVHLEYGNLRNTVTANNCSSSPTNGRTGWLIYEQQIGKAIRPYFDSMVKLDLQAIRRAKHEHDPHYKPGLRARIIKSFAEDGLLPAQRGDIEVSRALSRIFHMLEEPETVFKRPAIVARILRIWVMPKAKKEALDYYMPKLGPERAEMFAALGLAA